MPRVNDESVRGCAPSVPVIHSPRPFLSFTLVQKRPSHVLCEYICLCMLCTIHVYVHSSDIAIKWGCAAQLLLLLHDLRDE